MLENISMDVQLILYINCLRASIARQKEHSIWENLEYQGGCTTRPPPLSSETRPNKSLCEIEG